MFNRAVQARRQPGSAIKPIVYTAALEHGYTPVSVVLDQPITLMTPEGEWRPENYDGVFTGPVTVRDALAKSINLVAIQVLQDVGASVVVDYARRLGLQHRVKAVPALAIGACEVTPMELTEAYGIFANRGKRVVSHCVERMYDKNGRLLEQFEPVEEQVLSAATAFVITDMLTGVIQRGTGASIPGLGFTRQAAGKTGTTNDYSDAWFVGYTPQVVCGVWVGIDERRTIGRGVTGSRGAIPIWVETMKALHRTRPAERFTKPAGAVAVRTCRTSHKVANRYCPETELVYVLEGSMTDTCDVHALERTRRPENIHRLFGTQKRRLPPEEKNRRPLMF
jgi:penicillin-binding protein 1A